jgi:hypothetical protein
MDQHIPAQAKGKTMKARITFPLLPAALLVTPLALASALDAASAQSVTSPARSIAIAIGRGELITLPGRMSDVFVANNDIADVQVKATNQLYVFGKAGGETTVYASNGKGDVIWSANVRVGTNIDSVDQMLHLAMPDAKISTATMNNTVLLTGTVGAPEDAAEAERLVKAFVGEKTQVISRLKLATPLQVNLQVRIAEVSRSVVKSLTSNITSIDGTGGSSSASVRDRLLPPSIPAPLWVWVRASATMASTRRPGRSRCCRAPRLTRVHRHHAGGGGQAVRAGHAGQAGCGRNGRPCNHAGAAQPHHDVGRDRRFPGGRRIPDPDEPGPWHDLGRIQALWREPVLHADGALQRPHLDARAPGSVRPRRAPCRFPASPSPG